MSLYELLFIILMAFTLGLQFFLRLFQVVILLPFAISQGAEYAPFQQRLSFLTAGETLMQNSGCSDNPYRSYHSTPLLLLGHSTVWYVNSYIPCV